MPRQRFRLTCRRVGSSRFMRVGRASSGLLNTSENETDSSSSECDSSSSSSSDSSRRSSRRSSLSVVADSDISVASPSTQSIPSNRNSNSASGHESSDSNSDHSEIEINNGQNNQSESSHEEDNHSDSGSSVRSGSHVSLARRDNDISSLMHISSDSSSDSDSDSSLSSCSRRPRSCSPRRIWSSDSDSDLEVDTTNSNPRDQGDNSLDGSFHSGSSSNSNISIGSVFPRPSPASSDSLLGRRSPNNMATRAPRLGRVRAENQEVPQMPPTRGRGRGTRTNSDNAIPTANAEANVEANEGAVTVRRSTLFECCVCLEHLDQPASISLDEEEPNNNAPAENLPGPSGGSGTRRRTKASTTTHRVTPADTVATQCGHLYHQVCLEKWFNEQGRRTCPSCRKTIPKTKLTRLYPSLSGDTGPTPGCSTEVPTIDVEPGQAQACTNCQDLKDIHATLINDYSDLRTRYDNLHEEFDLKEAQLRSLEEDNIFKNNEIERLKRQMNDEIPAGSAAKRRRK